MDKIKDITEQNVNRRNVYLKRSDLSKREKMENLKKQEEYKKKILKELNKQNMINSNNDKNNTKPDKPNVITKTKGFESETKNKNLKNINKSNNTNKENKNVKNPNIFKQKNKSNNSKGGLKIVFLGGLGEVGKNIMAVEYDNEIFIIDAGSAFPSEDLPGIDLIVPDIDYLIKNKHKVKGIVITHGHEDHIGALPHVLNYVNVPIFGSRMTNALIEKKFNEKGSKKINPKLNTVKENQKIKLGRNFEIEFVHVNHSIAGAFALAIHTPVGTWVHTGDFKIDYTPIDGKVGNLSKLAKLGEKGVLLLTADSTNAERSGSTISEKNVGETLEALVEQYKDKRIIVSTFASNIYRVQQLVSLAEQTNRKIVFSGRSMLNVTEIAAKIGELKINKDVIIPINKLNKYKRNEVMIISTGSQGEPFSALTRMSSGDFKGVKLDENDAVILSASPIPGNEKAIGRVINNLYKSGAEVIYNKLAEVHVSGHAKAEELKLLHTLVKPKFFIPAHGEYRMLKAHEEIAHSLGMPKRRTLIAEIGDAVELTSNNIKRLNKVQAGRVLVDGFGFGDMESDALRDRKQLAEDGICVVTLGVNSATGRVEVGPEILAKGFLYSSDNANLIEGAKKNVLKSIEGLDLKKKDKTVIQEAITKSLTKYFSTKARRRPMVLPFIMEL